MQMSSLTNECSTLEIRMYIKLLFDVLENHDEKLIRRLCVTAGKKIEAKLIFIVEAKIK